MMSRSEHLSPELEILACLNQHLGYKERPDSSHQPPKGHAGTRALALCMSLLLLSFAACSQQVTKPSIVPTQVEESALPIDSPAPSPTPVLQIPTPLPLPGDLAQQFQAVASFSQALRLIPQLQLRHLIPEVRYIPELGMRQIIYRLPKEIASNPYVVLALGQPLPTRFQERLPDGIVAVVTHLPKEAIGVLGPFLWAQTNGVALQLYDVDVRRAYKALGYPDILLGEIYVEAPLGYPGPSPQLPFHPWDRIGGHVGADLARGDIPEGTVYVWTGHDGSWRLWEYPNVPSEGSIARLIWNFHPRDPKTGQRVFTIPLFLQQSQEREQNKTFSNPQKPQDNVGPSIILRTEEVTGQTDIVIVAPYLYLQNPDLLKDILYYTPIPDGTLPNPDHLIIGAGDLHYSSNGKMGLLLAAEEKGVDMALEEVETTSINVFRAKNHIGLYIGLRKGGQ